jgi:hypothetical protein
MSRSVLASITSVGYLSDGHVLTNLHFAAILINISIRSMCPARPRL